MDLLQGAERDSLLLAEEGAFWRASVRPHDVAAKGEAMTSQESKSVPRCCFPCCGCRCHAESKSVPVEVLGKWRDAFWHAYHRTHAHLPRGCAGCLKVQWALDEYMKPSLLSSTSAEAAPELRCSDCGIKVGPPTECPDCGSQRLSGTAHTQEKG